MNLIFIPVSGVLGTALVGGLVTANPVVTFGLFAGTVLTSVGSLISLTSRQKSRIKELERRQASSLGFNIKVMERNGNSLWSKFPLFILWEGAQYGREYCVT